MSDTPHLGEAVDATLARMAALKEAEAHLDRRRAAIRAMHFIDGLDKSEVFRVLNTALRDRGLTTDELRQAGVGHESIVKLLRSRD